MAKEIKVDGEKSPTKAVPAKIDYSEPGSLLQHIQSNNCDVEALKNGLSEHIKILATKFGVDTYEILVLIDEEDDISSWHSNRLYRAISGKKDKDILLIILSRGGRIEPAYLISKTCKRLSKDKFVISVPRKAKSAATLIALGADEIHMGLMSELGPIDPQVNGYPALGMKNALALLAELSCKHPEASEMLAQYLINKLDLHTLGYFERISESAMQYAERLLSNKKLPKDTTPQKLANHFVNHYKDHGFVIDADETLDLLGKDIVKQNTPEYDFANKVYEAFDLVKFFLSVMAKKEFYWVGGLSDSVYIRDKAE